ncbi:MAG: ABC transporter permease [Verrucomicrobiota bacterium]|nr:ABC transporter permease [Verrucomicrobiota bacterium]
MHRSRFPHFVTMAVLVFFYLPILMLVAQSFNASRFGGEWKGFTFAWYGRLFDHSQIGMATSNTLIIAIASTVCSLVLGTLAAWVLHRYKTRLQKVNYTLIYAPLIMPEVLMGISLLLLFVNLSVPSGLLTVIIAHITFSISYVTFVILGRLQDFDYSMIEAAQDLGANWWTILWRVLLPLLGPGLAAGGLLAFTLSIDDFVITYFVAGPGSSTLPVHVYSMMKHGSPTLINALCVLFMAVTFAIVLLSQRLIKDKI